MLDTLLSSRCHKESNAVGVDVISKSHFFDANRVYRFIYVYRLIVLVSSISRSRSTFNAVQTLIAEQRASGKPIVRAFFKGFGPTMARAFPANAATFFAYEMAMSAMGAHDPDEEPRGEFN